MKTSTMFTINSIVALVFGLVFIIAPAWTLNLYGISSSDPLNYVGQIFGASLLGFAIITFLARNAPASPTRSAIVLALFVSDAVGFVVSIIAQLKPVPVANALGWSTVAIYLLLALGFGYLQFMGKES